jgi:hypothetical protein
MGSGLSDAFNNALNGVKNNVGGLFTGRNPLTQPQVGELFGFNIQGAPLISTRDYFLLQLESWLTAIPLQSQWIILIQPFPSCINTSILQGLERTGGDSKNYDIDQARNLLTSYPFQSVNGCLFAQDVQLPNETMNIDKASVVNQRGFLPGIISNGRQTSNQLTIGFLETNTSFTDFVIRPWVIAAEHFGFVARERDTTTRRDPRNVKSTVYVLEYTRTFQNVSMIPRKVWTFFNCAPIAVQTRNLGYDEPNTAPKMTTTWTYTDYAISNSMYLPLPNIINRISSAFNGKFPTISPFQGGKGNGNFPQNISGFF